MSKVTSGYFSICIVHDSTSIVVQKSLLDFGAGFGDAAGAVAMLRGGLQPGGFTMSTPGLMGFMPGQFDSKR